LKEWTTPDCRNTPSTRNLEEEEIVDAPGNDGNASMPEQVKRPNPWRKMMMTFFDHKIILREHTLFLAKVQKHSVIYFVTLTLVVWQRVVFLCVSCTLFGMSLVMGVRHVLCSVRRYTTHDAQP